jgi:hypothetical protein
MGRSMRIAGRLIVPMSARCLRGRAPLGRHTSRLNRAHRCGRHEQRDEQSRYHVEAAVARDVLDLA